MRMEVVRCASRRLIFDSKLNTFSPNLHKVAQKRVSDFSVADHSKIILARKPRQFADLSL